MNFLSPTLAIYEKKEDAQEGLEDLNRQVPGGNSISNSSWNRIEELEIIKSLEEL